jgi:hypothetical protein
MSISVVMDETGWGHDLGFAKKPMVLSPLEEAQNVYYRAEVVSVNRQRKTVSDVQASGTGRAAAAHSMPAVLQQQHHCCGAHLRTFSGSDNSEVFSM